MNDPQNPLSQLLIELSRIFAAVPQTSEDERNSYIMALVEMARFVREAARSTQDTGLWEAQLRLSELAYALRDLGNGQVAPALRRTKRKAGSAPDSSVKWMKRVRGLGRPIRAAPVWHDHAGGSRVHRRSAPGPEKPDDARPEPSEDDSALAS